MADQRRSQHPGLHSILRKVHRRESLTGEEMRQLKRQIYELEGSIYQEGPQFEKSSRVDSKLTIANMLSGYATREQCERFAAHFSDESTAFYCRSVVVGTWGSKPSTSTIFIIQKCNLNL